MPELIGEALTGGEYRQLPLQRDADGILRGHSALLNLDICVRPGQELRLYDPAAGQWLLTPEEGYAALQEAEEENRRLREQSGCSKPASSHTSLGQADSAASAPVRSCLDALEFGIHGKPRSGIRGFSFCE